MPGNIKVFCVTFLSQRGDGFYFCAYLYDIVPVRFSGFYVLKKNRISPFSTSTGLCISAATCIDLGFTS